MSLEASYKKTTIQDLPNEMLEKILLKADVADRKSASEVCFKWSSLNYIWTSAQLRVDFQRDFTVQECRDMLLPTNPPPGIRLAPNRRYRHLHFRFRYLRKSKYNLMKDILIHYSPMLESLKIWSSLSEIKLEFFALVADRCRNLKQLKLLCNFEHKGPEPVFRSMNNLEELYTSTSLLSLITNMQAITPNISKLTLSVDLDRPIAYLRALSSQLQELEISFGPADNFLNEPSMEFPLLKILRIYCVVDLADNEARIERLKQLFQGAPELKELTLRRFISCRDFETLRPSFRNIECLCLQLETFREDSMQVILELRHLKRFRLEKTYISDGDLAFICESHTSLKVFSLHRTTIEHPEEISEFLQRTFPGLTVLELLYVIPQGTSAGQSFEFYANLCDNMTSLQRLTIKTHQVKIGAFLDFCDSREPRRPPELRMECNAIVGEPQKSKEKYSIPVETLILVADVEWTVLQTLIDFMGNLTRLEAVWRGARPEQIQLMREAQPRCEVTMRPKIQVEEPPKAF